MAICKYVATYADALVQKGMFEQPVKIDAVAIKQSLPQRTQRSQSYVTSVAEKRLFANSYNYRVTDRLLHLKTPGTLLKASLRAFDILDRLGGDELIG